MLFRKLPAPVHSSGPYNRMYRCTSSLIKMFGSSRRHRSKRCGSQDGESWFSQGARYDVDHPRRRNDARWSIFDHRRHARARTGGQQASRSAECRPPRLPFIKIWREFLSRSLHSFDLSRGVDQKISPKWVTAISIRCCARAFSACSRSDGAT